jgi:cytochrome c556
MYRHCCRYVDAEQPPMTRTSNPKEPTMTSLRNTSLVAILALACAAPAMAQFKNAKHAVEYRQAAFTVMGKHFASLGAMVSGKAPFDAAKAKADAQVVAMVSTLPWSGFGPETEDVKSDAKMEVWLEKTTFEQGAQRLTKAAADLATAADSGNLDQIKLAFGATAKSCKACHDSYRN